MNIDINKVLHIISCYQEEKDQKMIQMFQQEIYDYVKIWPKKIYSCNEDICHDFVVYIIEYTEQIIQSYDLNINVSFMTWFNAVLYNKFCDFSKQGEVSSQRILLDEDTINSASTFFSIDETTNLSIEKVSKIVFQELSEIDRAFWVFFYTPHQANEDILLTIAQHTQKDLQEILLCYQEILKQQHQNYYKRESYYLKIKDLDNKIAHIENIILKGSKTKDNEVLRQKNIRYKNRQNKYLRTLNRYSLISMKYFVSIFKDYDTAYRTLKKINHKIKKLIM